MLSLGRKKRSLPIWRFTLPFTPLLCAAQNFEPYYFNPFSTKGPGIHLHTVSVSSAVNSGAQGLGLSAAIPTAEKGVVSIVQAAGVLGWARMGTVSNISVTYSPSFSRGVSLLNYWSINQALSVSGGRRLGAKLSLNGSVNLIAMDFNQLLNGASPLTNLAQTPATFEELSSAVLSGKTANTQLAALTGSTPIVSTPETSFLYGVRHLSLASGVTLAYERSTRSAFSLSLSGGRTQVLGENDRFLAPGLPLVVQLQRTSNWAAGAGWNYSLTPRDTVSVNLTTSRIVSDYQNAFVSQATVSLGRKLSERWFVRGMAGVGFFNPLRESLPQGRFTRHEWGASVGYKVYAHTFLGSYTSLVSDIFGLGANSSISSAGAWSWKLPGHSTSVSSSFGYSQMVGSAFPNAGSWSVSSGVGQSLNSRTVLSISYRYIRFPQHVFFYSPSNSVNGLTTSLSWSPSMRE